MSSRLNNSQIERFSRQIILKEIGFSGQKKIIDSKVLIVGMGGSVLGTKAINSFLKFKIKKDIIFLDNLDDFKINKIKKKLSQKKILFILISKSGNTLETLSISNFLTSFITQSFLLPPPTIRILKSFIFCKLKCLTSLIILGGTS